MTRSIRQAMLAVMALGVLMLAAELASARAEAVTVKKSGQAAGSAAPSASSAPSAQPAPSTRKLPPGHPMLPGTGATSQNIKLPPKNITEASAKVPPGTIEIQVLDQHGKPLAGRSVRLGILHESVAEGDSHRHRMGRTDANGKVRFDGLSPLQEISYRVTVPDGVATYAADPFTLKRTMGEHVVLHIFPVTRDLHRALVGMRGVIYIEPREDIFQFEVLYSIYNIGTVTWVPNHVRLNMPDGFKAFTADDSTTDARFVAVNNDLILKGTYAPGEYDVGFRFQLPNPHDSTVNLDLPVPPHLADMRVIVSNAKGMDLRVAGFPRAQHAFDRNGQRVLITERQLHRGQEAMSDLGITLIGLPTPGNGRWYALLIAIVFISGGLFSALVGRHLPWRKRALPQNLESAHDLLLNELVLLEHAKQTQAIGPKSYERTRRQLLDALARLEAQRARDPARRAERSLKAGPAAATRG